MLKDEYDINYIRELDSLIMLLKADSETLDMMLTNIWEMRESYERAGVIIGDA